ncbi:MAG: phycobiliprotein lyase [Cyanobacteria bacterium P01_E01_bin.34]
MQRCVKIDKMYRANPPLGRDFPSMTLEEFLQHSAGDWLSQQTNHDVDDNRYASGRSTIAVEALTPSSSDLVAICQQHDIDPASTAGGLKYVWMGRLDGDKSDRTETSISIFIPEGESAQTGKLVRTSNTGSQPPPSGQPSTATGHYSLGNDDALTMNASSDAGASKERIWFASENLRIRSSIVETADGFSAASLSSDIRKLSSKPAA